MADSASESDTDAAGGGPAAMQSSCSATSGGSGGGGGGGGKSGGIVISPFRLEELTNRLASLQQENKVLKIELETYKLKCKALQEENRDLRKASVTIVSAPRGPRVGGEGPPECAPLCGAAGLRGTGSRPWGPRAPSLPWGVWRCLGRLPYVLSSPGVEAPPKQGWRLAAWLGGRGGTFSTLGCQIEGHPLRVPVSGRSWGLARG